MGVELFFVHSVSVETYTGSGAYGDIYAAPAQAACFIDDGIHLTRDASGVEVVSSSVVYAPAGDVAMFPPGSRVTLNSRQAHVISTNRRDSGPLGLPDHIEVHLT